MTTDWQIQVPYKTLGDSLSQVGANARALQDPEDRAVVHELVLLATGTPGATDAITAGDLIDVLKAIPPDRRRGALDVLRKKAGLPSTAEVERKALLDSVTYSSVGSDTRPIPTCAADDCQAIHREPGTWTPSPLDVKRWFCEQHRSLAQPGDMEPPARLQFAPSGGLEPIPPVDGITRATSTGAGWTA